MLTGASIILRLVPDRYFAMIFDLDFISARREFRSSYRFDQNVCFGMYRLNIAKLGENRRCSALREYLRFRGTCMTAPTVSLTEQTLLYAHHQVSSQLAHS